MFCSAKARQHFMPMYPPLSLFYQTIHCHQYLPPPTINFTPIPSYETVSLSTPPPGIKYQRVVVISFFVQHLYCCFHLPHPGVPSLPHLYLFHCCHYMFMPSYCPKTALSVVPHIFYWCPASLPLILPSSCIHIVVLTVFMNLFFHARPSLCS